MARIQLVLDHLIEQNFQRGDSHHNHPKNQASNFGKPKNNRAVSQTVYRGAAGQPRERAISLATDLDKVGYTHTKIISSTPGASLATIFQSPAVDDSSVSASSSPPSSVAPASSLSLSVVSNNDEEGSVLEAEEAVDCDAFYEEEQQSESPSSMESRDSLMPHPTPRFLGHSKPVVENHILINIGMIGSSIASAYQFVVKSVRAQLHPENPSSLVTQEALLKKILRMGQVEHESVPKDKRIRSFVEFCCDYGAMYPHWW